jgi:Tol biopolymer transport system component
MARRFLALALLTLLVDAGSVNPASAAFPGANGTIVFSKRPALLTLITRDGATTKLAHGEEPAWSADGTRIAFDNESDLWTIAPDRSGLMRVTSGSAFDASPAWSPDGSALVFERQNTSLDDTELYAVNIASPLGMPTRLTNTASFELDPVWSPDGTRIAFSVNECDAGGCGYRIGVMHADGSHYRLLTPAIHATEVTPDWSPDSATLLFASNRHHLGRQWDLDVYTIPAAGGAVTRITRAHGRVRNGAPVWSPDGSRFLYIHATRSGRHVLQSAAFDGSAKTTIARVPTTGQFSFVADWQAVS